MVESVCQVFRKAFPVFDRDVFEYIGYLSLDPWRVRAHRWFDDCTNCILNFTRSGQEPFMTRHIIYPLSAGLKPGV